MLLFRRKPEPQRSVVLDTNGFSFREDEKTLWRVDWHAVREIVAFKLDLFAYDEICLGFRTDDTDRYAEVWESDPAYQEVLASLPLHFSGIRTDWFSEVAYPAFATNWTTLWIQPLESQKN